MKYSVYLTTQEISEALIRQGAENVVTLVLPTKLDTITEFLIVSGRSTKHLKSMADTVVTAVKLDHHFHVLCFIVFIFEVFL